MRKDDTMSESNEWLEYIQAIREKNNKLWVSILRLALTSAPEEAKSLLREIRVNDLLISEATGKLADADIKPKRGSGSPAVHNRGNLSQP